MSEQSSSPKIAMDIPFSIPFAIHDPSITGGVAAKNPLLTNAHLTTHAATSAASSSSTYTSQLDASKPPATPRSTAKGKNSKAQPDLTADVNAILADYEHVLSRVEQENADILAAARRIAASRKNMTRAFNDVARARQRMTTIFDKARATVHPSSAPNSPYGGTGNNNSAGPGHGRGSGHKRTPPELSRINLERRRWDFMKRYEELYRERKEVDVEVARMEQKRGKDAEWVQGMFLRVAEKGLFEATVIREKKRMPVVLNDEEGEEVGY